jgi:uncharacterized tellurite resistance protein B-like protein
VRVAQAYEGVSEREQQALSALLGAELIKSLPSPEAAQAELKEVLAQVRQDATLSERARLLQHLTLIAAADGNVAEEEFAELQHCSEALSVPLSIIDETLSAAAHPLD